MATRRLKRPRDPIQLGKLIVDIATGQVQEPEETKTTKRAQAAGKKGGPARAASLTPEERAEIARIAASARWKKSRA
jgi:hypothetical protein